MYMKQPATGHIATSAPLQRSPKRARQNNRLSYFIHIYWQNVALQRLNSYFCIAYHQKRNQSANMLHSIYKKVTILLHLQNKCLILERKIIQLIV